ncbi:DUF4245 domain-containing protein [Jidongwangia harbinensis]|uniref:DUF4245 domain-containing protein n=1 Tax=Jidongwangia harbinensis TaxID=2878561 RepID=UPI001CDA552D|nr:DUF4245 domain-containing protein [Jidongwangia harbinensis]MCA2218644.1 DUF4245 domain-containing protein [Jidongwangia harbinensis]
MEPDAPDADQRPITLGKREGRSPRDMALSLAVLLIPIALLLTFYRVVLDGDEPIRVDPAPAVQEARSAGAFPVVLPAGLGDDWRVTTAMFRRQDDGATLRLGYVDPGDDPVQLVQSSVPAETLLPAELTEDAEVRGMFRAPSGVWRRYDARPGEAALVLAESGRTVVVVGRSEWANLEALASSLS